MKKTIGILFAATLFLLIFWGCETDPFGATDDRPAIPIPATYESELADYSNVMLIEIAAADATDFQPEVLTIWDGSTIIYGDTIATTGKRLVLMDDGTLKTSDEVAAEDANGGSGLSTAPKLVFERYWERIGDVEYYAGSTTKEITTTSTQKVTETQTYSFTETLSSATEVSTDALFASASVKLSLSFSATQEFTNTSWASETYSTTVSITGGSGQGSIYHCWQLHERLRYVDADFPYTAGQTYAYDDETAPDYSDTSYRFNTDSIVWDFPTQDIVPIITVF